MAQLSWNAKPISSWTQLPNSNQKASERSSRCINQKWSGRRCCPHELNLFRLSGIQVEPFIAKSRSSPLLIFITFYKRQSSQAPSQAPDSVYSGRILSLPDGYHFFRTGSVHTERILDIRGVSGVSI